MLDVNGAELLLIGAARNDPIGARAHCIATIANA
jgi:hypothetical protein